MSARDSSCRRPCFRRQHASGRFLQRNGRADSIANDRADSDGRRPCRSQHRAGRRRSSNASTAAARSARSPKTRSADDAQRRPPQANSDSSTDCGARSTSKLCTTASRLKEDEAITALLKEEFSREARFARDGAAGRGHGGWPRRWRATRRLLRR